MTQILKRLEIIKSSIAIEDEELIDLQVINNQNNTIKNANVTLIKSKSLISTANNFRLLLVVNIKTQLIGFKI